ncbi:MAG: thermonuclease family protein [Gammaproteobacteria bacterium]|nr:thermonuclease family protein [Gammaproteobacteria bacterium]MDH5591827.1 thermonuclease family protein [Gammaproteobacteria bacterium]
MKHVIKGLIVIGLLMQANLLLADIFRSQDTSGNVSFSDQPSENSTLVKPAVRAYRYKHHVARVYDGDTIVLKNGEHVRLLGINTPEIESRHREGAAGGQMAKKWLKDKLQQKSVFLEYDQQQHDKYDRLLAHLFLPSGEYLNAGLLTAGLAHLSVIPPNLRYLDELQKAENDAQQAGRGIWSMMEYQPQVVTTQTKEFKRSGWQRFVATPIQIKQGRKYVRLILTDKMDIRISKDNLTLFPDLKSYLGQSLEIRGWSSRNKDHYSILVRHPSAIIVH